MTAPAPGRVIAITGAMAAGKSTVAELLAERLPASVHVRGDAFRKMIVNGRAEMTPQPTPEATRQLMLRYELAIATAERYAADGFDAVVQDVVVGSVLDEFVRLISWPRRYLVVLSPTAATLQLREQARTKAGYVHFSPDEMDAALRTGTPRLGYWLDSSAQTPEETVDDILSHLDRAAV